jgi:hypothetical protein
VFTQGTTRKNSKQFASQTTWQIYCLFNCGLSILLQKQRLKVHNASSFLEQNTCDVLPSLYQARDDMGSGGPSNCTPFLTLNSHL